MNKSWRVILTFMGIFAAGSLSGLLVAPRLFKNVAERRPPPVPTHGAQQFGPQLIHRLTEKLDLTPEQRNKIKPIELRTTEELRRLRRDTQHGTEQVIERMQDDIAAELTPEQRTKFDEMIARGRERIKKFMQDQEQLWKNRRESGSFNHPHEDDPPPK